jgi:hypothetical protein
MKYGVRIGKEKGKVLIICRQTANGQDELKRSTRMGI